MFSRVWTFVKRNRGKIFVASMVAGGALVAVNYLREKLRAYQEIETAALCENARKYHHFDNVQRSCNITVLSMLADVGIAIQKCFDVEKLLAELEQGTNDRITKWQQLKIMSIARAMSTLYSCCILVALLRVQFNIIAGYMYPQSVSFNTNAMPDITEDAPDTRMASLQNRYLNLIQYFVNEGIPRLCACVQATVAAQLDSLPLKEKITLQDLSGKLDGVRGRVEGSSPGSTALTQFMMPDDHIQSPSHIATDDDEFYETMVKATTDTIKSEYFHGVLQQCLQKGHTQLLEFVAETYTSIQKDPTHPECSPIGIPLAKLIPVMSGLHSRMSRSELNTFMPQLMIIGPMRDFSLRVYEAASYRDAPRT